MTYVAIDRTQAEWIGKILLQTLVSIRQGWKTLKGTPKTDLPTETAEEPYIS